MYFQVIKKKVCKLDLNTFFKNINYLSRIFKYAKLNSSSDSLSEKQPGILMKWQSLAPSYKSLILGLVRGGRSVFLHNTDISSPSPFLSVGEALEIVKADTAPFKLDWTTVPEPKSHTCRAQMIQQPTISTQFKKRVSRKKESKTYLSPDT